jgi:hypothetical protein
VSEQYSGSLTPYLCYGSTYIYTLLTVGFGFRENENFTSIYEEYYYSWTLGAMIVKSRTLDQGDVYVRHRWFDQSSGKALFGIGLLVMVINSIVVGVGVVLLNRHKKRLSYEPLRR